MVDGVIMTQRDLVLRIVRANKPATDIEVCKLASKPPITARAFLALRMISAKILDNKLRRVVVKEENSAVGIVSDTDMFRAVQDFHWDADE